MNDGRFEQQPRRLRRGLQHVIEPPAPELEQLFRRAFAEFLVSEHYLLAAEVSERTMCARLAMIIERMAHEDLGLFDYRADVEYNRMQHGALKRILRNGHLMSLTCDLVLQGRGLDQRHENLIAIEIKKWDDEPNKCDDDRDRLRSLTGIRHTPEWPRGVAGYRYGFFVVLCARRTGRGQQWWRDQQRDEDPAAHPDYPHGYFETFQDGRRVDAPPSWFHTALPPNHLRAEPRD